MRCVSLFLLLVGSMACFSSASGAGSDVTSCVPAATAPCACPSGFQGEQTCNADGSAFGPCFCSGEGGAAGSSGTGAAGGSGGGAMACEPGAVTSCYTGPAGTEGKGSCKAGTAVCKDDGSGPGPCSGLLTPGAEVCSTPADDDCNGSPTPCKQGWAKRYPWSYSGPSGVAPSPGGHVRFAAMFQGGIDFGGGLLPGGLCVVDLGPGGAFGSASCRAALENPVWPYVENPVWPFDLAVDAQGNSFVTGIYSTAVDLGGGALPDFNPSGQAFVLALDPNGGHLYSRGFGSAPTWTGGDWIAVDAPTGRVVVTGVTSGSIDLGAGPVDLGPTGGLWAVALDAAGETLWSYGVPGAGSASVAFEPTGEVVMAGAIQSCCPADFGTGPVAAEGTADAFVLKLGADGSYLWHEVFGGPGRQRAAGVATDASGSIVVTGSFSGEIDFGAGPLTETGIDAAFVAKLDPDGNPLWVKTAGSSGKTVGTNVAIDPDGNAIVMGQLTDGTADFGGGALIGSAADLFLARFDPGGAHLSSVRYGESMNLFAPTRIASTALGHPLMTIHTQGPETFSDAQVDGEGFVVVEIAP